MARELYYDEEARRKLQAGVDKLADAVKITIGPKGRNVLVENIPGKAMVTNDGVTVANGIELQDYTENMGAQLVKQVAAKANDLAGDGTTTATLLAQVMINEGMKNAAAGANPILLRKGIKGAVEVVTEELRKNARPIDTREAIAQIASISSSDESVGEMIAEAMERVGRDGVINIAESRTMETTLNITDGTTFDKGYISDRMVTDEEKMEAVLTNPYILFTDKQFYDMQDVFPILEKVLTTKRPLLIVADRVEGDALKALIVNKVKGIMNIVAVKAPGAGERKKAMMSDFALVTGGTYIQEELGADIREATLDMLGQAERVVVRKDRTIIINGAGNKEEVKERIAKLQVQLAAATTELEDDKARERLGKLYGGIALIKVGAASDAELKETKLRIEDALNAARAAVAEGVVAGGGVALCETIPAVDQYVETLEGDVKTGAQIVRKALEGPISQIAENAGLNGGVVVAEVLRREPGVGLNAATMEYVPMIEAGIIDPVKVTRSAVESAASIASTFLTVEADVVDPVDEASMMKEMNERRQERRRKREQEKQERQQRNSKKR